MKKLLYTSAVLSLLSGCCSMSKNEKINVAGKQGHNLPIVDLDARSDMQVTVDREDGQYLGHPTTLLLDDGKTIICVYPKGHGRGPIVMKKSYDGGKTWSKRLPTPKSWNDSKEVPPLSPVVDANGKKRIIMFSGAQDWVKIPIRMAISEDNGNTWSELKSIGDYYGIVAMADCTPLSKPGHYLGTLHVRGPKGTMILQTVKSSDGGLTWSKPTNIYQSAKAHLCEAGIVQSPDGKELALLLRENARNYNSQIMFSKDDGQTWSKLRPMPGSLCGDRHQAVYLPDGRLLIQFRDRTPNNRLGNQLSPTEGDWAGWVGTWEDLKMGYEGEYRIRFKDNMHGWDSTYPAAELLPDGTLVCTTYGYWDAKHKPFIMSLRFKIEQLDEVVKTAGKVKNHMGKNLYLYDPNNPNAINKAQK